MSPRQKFGSAFDVEDIRARRHTRRALRAQRVYAQVQDALSEVEGAFSSRTALVWGMPAGESARRVQGHAGAQAAMFVSETLGEYHVPGMVNTKFIDMKRSAGSGGHGITEGVITVEVEVRPIQGMMQRLEVPVQVKQGYLVRPGVLYHEGSPYVISQSALDEIMDSAVRSEYPVVDRKNQYSPPASYNGLPHTASVDVNGRGLSQREMGVPTKDQYLQQEQAKKEQEEAEAKAKARRKQRSMSPRPTMIARVAQEIFVPNLNDASRGTFIRAGAPVVVMPDEEDDDLIGLNLQGARLQGQDLRSYDLERADMRGANCQGADLTGVVMSDAHAEGANFMDAAMRQIDASNTDFSNAKMHGARIENAKLSGCSFSGADVSEVYFQGSDLSGANFEGANLSGSYFASANLAGANFQGANIKGAKLANALNADLTGAVGTPKATKPKEPKAKTPKKASVKLVHIRDASGVEALVDPALLIWE